MARIRTIKPTFFTSLTIASLTPEQRLTFIGLWTHVDDEGRCIYDPRLIKAAVWPLDNRTAADVDSDVRALTESSLITHYTVGERSYLQVRTWDEHQRINRKTPSAFPDPETGETTPLTCGDESSLSPHGALSEDSRQEGNKEGNKEGKGRARKRALAARASALPADWKPTQEHISRATQDGIDIEREVIKFRAWADEGNTSKSWNGRFTRWLLNAAEYQARRSAPAPATPTRSPWDTAARPPRREETA